MGDSEFIKSGVALKFNTLGSPKTLKSIATSEVVLVWSDVISWGKFVVSSIISVLVTDASFPLVYEKVPRFCILLPSLSVTLCWKSVVGSVLFKIYWLSVSCAADKLPPDVNGLTFLDLTSDHP